MALSPDRDSLPSDRKAPPKSAMTLNGGLDVDEYLDVGPGDPDEIKLTDDGSGGAFVDLPGHAAEGEPPDVSFYDNLAETIPDQIKSKIVTELLRSIEQDKEDRQKRDQQYEEGIRRTGLGNDAPGGANFEGASRVVHPMMTEACVDYESRVIKELFPIFGPVRPKIIGTVTAEKSEKAERVTEHMNWQLTAQIKEARSVLETTLTQVPLGGSQFIRQWQDHRLKRPRWEFVAIDNVYIPASAADFQSAHRKTFRDTVSAVEFRQRVEAGQYLDLKLAPPSQSPEQSKAATASQKVEGVETSAMNLDGDRTIYETVTYIEVTEEMADLLKGGEEAGQLYPFLVSIDESTKTMLGLYRDWEDGDKAREPIEHLYEFPFVPWRGAYSIGFPQMIGGLSAAATGALRALLDSAHINNAAGGFILKGSSASGSTKQPEPGTFVEVEGGLEADDIRKRVMPFAVNQPSAVLFQLLGFLVDAGKGIVRTSLDETPMNSAAPVPVGTQLSRVEEGMVVFSAVHGRAHAALDRLLRGLHRLNRLYLPESLKVDAAGKELLVRRADYEGPCDIQPVSDPTIYSDQQRFAQLNYIQQRAQLLPQIYDLRAVELAGLKLIKWADPETILQKAPQPHELNAVNENLAMALGQPVVVFPEQDHKAHLQVLLDFMQNPVLGGNPLIAHRYIPIALQHAAEHILYLYVSETVRLVREAAGGIDPSQLMSEDAGVKAMFDRLLAQASQTVGPAMVQQLQGAMPVLEKAMQAAAQASQQPGPMDPAQATMQASLAETQRKAAADKATQALNAQKLAIQVQGDQTKAQIADAANQTKIVTTNMDNQTAEDIASKRMTSGAAGGNFTDGQSLTH